MSEIHLRISGMTCSACSSRIENALRRLDSVQDAAVSLATSSAIVSMQGNDVDVSPLINKIRTLGYDAERKSPSDANPFQTEARGWRDRFIVSAVLSAPLLFALLAHVFGLLREFAPNFFFNPYYQTGIGSLLFFYSGYPFLIGAVKSLRRPNMDVLIALGMLFAYIHSLYQVIMSPSHAFVHGTAHLHFDSIAMIATSVTFGKWLETIAKGNAIKSLMALNELHSHTVRVIRNGRSTEQVPIAFVRSGDRASVQAGERIPIDGIVDDGIGEVDESLLTGESITQARRIGDRVYAGTMLVTGAVSIRSSSKGTETRLANLIAMVEHAQAKKPKIQRQADLVGAWFVPAMILISILTFVGWNAASSIETAIGHAMAVLLVACPCALGLATPISVLIGSSLAARKGIAFKEGSALETLSRVNVIIFDKTGTLTKGQPSLTGMFVQDMPSSQLLRFTASLERNSEHPLAKAIVREANAKRLLLSDAKEKKEALGEGISGVIDNHAVVIGNLEWLKKNSIAYPPSVTDFRTNSDSVLHVAIAGKWAGLLSFRDAIREDAVHTVRSLSRTTRIVMATGDKEDAAARIAAEVGIANVQTRMLPERKLESVLEYQRKGDVVAMVGDGANDAAAMAAANVGIVMAGGNDAAMQAGDVVLLGGKLSGIENAISIARGTMRNIKQNLAIACLYNVVMIPLAVAGQLDPRASCVAMATSSLLVVGNALRLRRLALPGLKESIVG